jgi:DNA-binding NarL/FixJ family response regulator
MISRMHRAPGTAELWDVGARSHDVGWRVAVLSDDLALASRATEALEREGLIVTLEAVGRDVAALETARRRPTMLIVEALGDEQEIEHILDWAGKRLAGAVVLVVLRSAERFDVGLLLSVGADAVVLERDLDMVLGPVARAAAAGQVSVPAELRHPLQRPALSHRERQILGLAVRGLTNAQIARRFYISESTVKTHLSSAFRRLGVHSRREAAALIFASDEVLRRSVLGSVHLSAELPGGDDSL